MNQGQGLLGRRARWLIWLAGAVVLFAIGRHLAPHSVDFVVYYRAAKSLLAGRTDLYSSTFSFGPPMTYLYPPIFLLLIFPLGWLNPANAYAAWFALQGLATAGSIRAGFALWRPRSLGLYAWTILALTGPYVVMALRYGNAHLLVVALTIFGVVAWARDRQWTSSAALALGGAIKVFPLFLVPVFLVRREWTMIWRMTLISAVLWAVPIVYFGPRTSVLLYESWAGTLLGNRTAFEKLRALDQSLWGASERWLTYVDYLEYRDRDYPQVNVTQLGKPAARFGAMVAAFGLLGASLWACAKLGNPAGRLGGRGTSDRESRVAASAGIFVAAQLVLGPYTPLLYFSELLLLAVSFQALWPASRRLNQILAVIGTLNLFLFAIPGAKSQRALQAGGAFTLAALTLWGLALYGGRRVTRAEEVDAAH